MDKLSLQMIKLFQKQVKLFFSFSFYIFSYYLFPYGGEISKMDQHHSQSRILSQIKYYI